MGGDLAGLSNVNFLNYAPLGFKIPFYWYILRNQTMMVDGAVFIKDVFTDKAIQGRIGLPDGVTAGRPVLVARSDVDGDTIAPNNNNYYVRTQEQAAANDISLHKYVAGTPTQLGVEAVDLTVRAFYACALNCNGTTIAVYRGAAFNNNEIQGSSSISATDSAHASGKFGLDGIGRMWINAYDVTNVVDNVGAIMGYLRAAL